ncbi:hypothetical protein PISL3812_02110 [Talaromyces islandicus]|uniref:Uncharacterized protein n=1 Tax=Talaromyces islandicus TaxID=28573 RepID=A0A0U1LP02_TALIS|nr:hypothetical protein PISL3812_02110 [Talaromyces islandicus]
MHVQNLFTFCVAALAGSAIAAEYNGGEVPAALRHPHGKQSSASISLMATPSSSTTAMSEMAFHMPSSAAMMMATVTVTPTITATPSSSDWPSTWSSTWSTAWSSGWSSTWSTAWSTAWSSTWPSTWPSASPSSSMTNKSFTSKVSPSSSQVHPSSASHVATASSTPLTDKPSIPKSDWVGNKNDTPTPAAQTTDTGSASVNIKETPAPATQTTDTGSASVNTKDDCSVHCQNLANQCVELLPKDNDFCWNQYPACQDRCVKQHVGARNAQ